MRIVMRFRLGWLVPAEKRAEICPVIMHFAAIALDIKGIPKEPFRVDREGHRIREIQLRIISWGRLPRFVAVMP